jgi:hypothetical protein
MIQRQIDELTNQACTDIILENGYDTDVYISNLIRVIESENVTHYTDYELALTGVIAVVVTNDGASDVEIFSRIISMHELIM